MIKVHCYSGHRINERPVSFFLRHQVYQVEEILDRWYSENSVYFKIKANDENIYLLKYDELNDEWDMIFYQNPRKLDVLMFRDPQEAMIVSNDSVWNKVDRRALLN